MIHINKILSLSLKRHNKNSVFDEKFIESELDKFIKKNIPGAEMFFYKDNILTLKCKNSFYANEIFHKKDQVKGQINEFFNKTVINKIILKS